MVSTTRIDTKESERAKSLAKLTTCEPFTPVAGSISYLVITGPGDAATTRTSTPKSFSFFSIMRLVISRVSGETVSCLATAPSSKSTCGKRESTMSLNKGFCRSLATLALLGISTFSGSITTAMGGCSSISSRSTWTISSRSRAATNP